MSFPAGSVEFVSNYFEELKQCIDSIPAKKVAQVADCLLNAYDQNKLVAIIGNGGSAATASHMACDFGKTIIKDDLSRNRFRVLSLVDNAPSVTAWANDVGYETIFSEQLRTWVSSDDVVIAISASGNSENICEGLRVARMLGAMTIGLFGFNGGQAAALVDLSVVVPSEDYGNIEDLHMIFGHLVTAYIRKSFIHSESRQRTHNGKPQSSHLGRRGRDAVATPYRNAAKADAAD